MPFSDFRLMALALVVIAGCALATTLRSFGFTRWFPPKVRRLVQKCRKGLARKPKEVHYDNSWTFQYGEAEPGYTAMTDDAGKEHQIHTGEPFDKPRRPRRKRRPKA
jgi:hypothetical protein